MASDPPPSGRQALPAILRSGGYEPSGSSDALYSRSLDLHSRIAIRNWYILGRLSFLLSQSTRGTLALSDGGKAIAEAEMSVCDICSGIGYKALSGTFMELYPFAGR